MKLWDCITKENQERIIGRYKKRFGIEFIPPTKERAIHCETKIEDLEEIAKLMAEVPNPTRRE